MKTAGIIGGIGPESTIEYYRSIIGAWRQRKGDGSYPSLVINSIDLQKMLGLISAGKLAEVADYLLVEIQKLARAGADFGVIAANTPHVVFDDLRHQSPIELISIVEVTCHEAQRHDLRRVGLFGTRFTMQGGFFQDIFVREGIALVLPTQQEQDTVHGIYMNELVNGIFRQESRDRLLAIVDRLRLKEEIDGLILGGTELPLILRPVDDPGNLFLNTTQLHVDEVVGRLLR